MVDVVYKKSLPELRNSLSKLKEEFSRLDTKTDWTKLRIDPLLEHLESLERVLKSVEFSRESLRLRRGVVLFHSDLVYYRTNLAGLKEILEAERKKGGEKGIISPPRRVSLPPPIMLLKWGTIFPPHIVAEKNTIRCVVVFFDLFHRRA